MVRLGLFGVTCVVVWTCGMGKVSILIVMYLGEKVRFNVRSMGWANVRNLLMFFTFCGKRLLVVSLYGRWKL